MFCCPTSMFIILVAERKIKLVIDENDEVSIGVA